MTPILLLHGALGSELQLEPLGQELTNKGRDVYTMNFSGHGKSPLAPSFGIEQFANDVLTFLDGNKLKTVQIFGYSMGGYVAVWLALNYPGKVEGIVTLGTKFDWDPDSARKEVAKLNPEKIEEKIPGFARILQQRHSPELWKKLLNETSAMMTKLGDRPLLHEENLKTLQLPVTICLGDRDDMADRSFSEQVANILPDGKFVLFENTAHPIEKVQIERLVDILV
jgi:pimeloyl-ACP methyl ester carboxylesterase